MDEDIYRTIAVPAEGYFKNKGSKFLSFAYPVENTEDIKELVQVLKTKYHDARHHCYAYVLGVKGDQFRANDDREPSGTAGKPILGQIHSNNLTNILVVVVRYFGGTLLGTSGLIEAYKTASADVIAKSTILEKTENKTYKINFDFSIMNELLRIIRDEKATVVSKELMNSGFLEVAVRLKKATVFEEKLHNIKGISIIE